MASTRQFDNALEEYERIVSEPKNIEHGIFDWESAIRSGISIAVRVKKDPERVLSIVNRVIANPKAPYYLREQATQWKESLNAWKAERPSQAQTEEGFYVQAIRLIADAKKLQKYPVDRSADILYLRASAAVHDLLGLVPKGTRATDALYLAGLCYEVLDDLTLGDMHEFYYLACILNSPHTEKARQCYERYEESVYLGYSGSGGTHLPMEIREKLRRLDKISGPETDPLTAPGQLR